MLTNICLNQLRVVGRCLRQQASRNFGVSAVACQQVQDPIQQLFVNKIREYAQKSKAGQLDVSQESQKQLEAELLRLEKTYDAKGKDMNKFPAFNYADQAIDLPPTEPLQDEHDLPLK